MVLAIHVKNFYSATIRIGLYSIIIYFVYLNTAELK